MPLDKKPERRLQNEEYPSDRHTLLRLEYLRERDAPLQFEDDQKRDRQHYFNDHNERDTSRRPNGYRGRDTLHRSNNYKERDTQRHSNGYREQEPPRLDSDDRKRADELERNTLRHNAPEHDEDPNSDDECKKRDPYILLSLGKREREHGDDIRITQRCLNDEFHDKIKAPKSENDNKYDNKYSKKRLLETKFANEILLILRGGGFFMKWVPSTRISFSLRRRGVSSSLMK
jgi:hypothetical protein